MKRTHNKISDSDDDMDDLPLKYITLDSKKSQAIDPLRSYSVHACEFCEKMFENKYDYLIHNAKHIIIPLIKMLPCHCTECGVCCFSEEEMNDHISVTHSDIMKPNDLKNDDGKLKVPEPCNLRVEHIEDESNEDDRPLNYLIKKEKDIVGVKTKNVLQNFVMNCKVDIEKFVPTWQYESDEDEIHDEMDSNKSGLKNHVAEFTSPTKLNNISNGVMFKNEVVKLMSSSKSNNIVKSNVDSSKNPVVSSNDSLAFSDMEDNPIVRLTSAREDIVTECSSKQDSVHFDDLIKPGIFYCKRCFKRFPNRFEVILHEIVHLNMNVAAPESYHLNAKTNSAKNVPLASNTTSKYVACHNSNKEISDIKMHAMTCMKFHCADCGQGFNEKNLLSAHETKCIGLAVVMCDTCLYLRKRPKHVRYYGIIRFNNSELKQLCHWCAKQCNEMSEVTLVNRQRLADRIKFEGDIGEQGTSIEKYVAVESENKNGHVEKQSMEKKKRGKERGHKILSNRERLKLIQNRLKLMKK